MKAPSPRSIGARDTDDGGWLVSYLPENRHGLTEWQRSLRLKAAGVRASGKKGYDHESVQALADVIAHDPIVRLYVEEAIKQASAYGSITDTTDMLVQLDIICTISPQFNKDINLRALFPMSALFVHMMAVPAGKALFRNEKFNNGLRRVLRTWTDYLDSPSSLWVLNTDPSTGWFSEAAISEFKLDDYEIDWGADYFGFTSYNDFFHRKIKPEHRPVSGVDDPLIITSPSDGTIYKIATDAALSECFWIKERKYSIKDMLNDPGEVILAKFSGGTVVQIFLSGADYHRWHAPVDGVVDFEHVDGLLFSENEDPIFDPRAGVESQLYGSAVNNRGLIFIAADDPRLGTLCVLPVGITEISSITVTAQKGQKVKKGDEIGYFSYGGSTVCLLFERGVAVDFGILGENDKIRVNSQIASLTDHHRMPR